MKPILLFLAAPLLVFTALWLQGQWVRSRVPVLPEADGLREAVVGDSDKQFRLLVVGESTAVGVGVDSMLHALPAQTAVALTGGGRSAVCWKVIGRSGVTARELGAVYETEPVWNADCVLLVTGINDTKALRSAGRWRKDLSALLAAIRKRQGPVPVLITGVAPMGEFPALPQPLRALLGWRATVLAGVQRDMAANEPNLFYVPVGSPSADLFSSDGFHPGRNGYAAWAQAIAAEMEPISR